jgi:hypothetical protein
MSFYNATQHCVAGAIQNKLKERDAFVSPLLSNWITIFDADIHCSPDADNHVGSLAQAICPACKCPSFALVIDGPDLIYWLFDADSKLIERTHLKLGQPNRKPTEGLKVFLSSVSLPHQANLISDFLGSVSPLGIDIVNILHMLFHIPNLQWSYIELFKHLDSLTDEDVVGWSQFAHAGIADPRG